MKKLTLLPCAALLTLALATGCDDELAPDADAGTPGTGGCTELTYVNFGKPLLDSKCVSCHSASVPSGDVRLDTVASVRASADEVIFHAVYQFPPAMPYNQPPLPQADLDKLEQWLNCGAP